MSSSANAIALMWAFALCRPLEVFQLISDHLDRLWSKHPEQISFQDAFTLIVFEKKAK